MSLMLYDVTVPGFQQILTAMSAMLDKAESFCTGTSLDPAAMIGTRLADDMLPFGYQVKAVVGHSVGAIDGLRAGIYSPGQSPWPTDFAGLKAITVNALDALTGLDPKEVNNFVGRNMAFVMGDYRMDFTAENFLLSFSLPNFYFHAATAYDILRWKGVKLGKRDYIGRPRVKT